MSGWRGGLRDERGAGTVEYVGVGAIVVIVVLAVIMQVTPVGGAIASQICRAFGAECGTPGGDGEASPVPEPTRACTVESSSENYSVEGSVLIIDGGGGVQIRREVKSDGSIEVTVIDTARLGASIKAPGADVTVDGGVVENVPIVGGDGEVGVDVGADAGANASLAYGEVFTFSGDDAAEQADQLIDYTRWSKGGDAAGGLIGGPGIGIGIGDLVDFGYRWLNDYSPPSPSAHLIEGGLEITANASADILFGGAGGEISAQNVLGGRRTAEGDTTVYLQGNITAEGGANFLTVGADGSASGQLVGEVTLDSSGEIIGVAFSAAGTAEGSVGITDFFGNPLTDLSGEGGKGVVARAEITVNDANRAQVMEALGQVGMLGQANLVGAQDNVQVGAEAIAYLMAESQRTGGTTAEITDVGSDTLLSAALGGKLPGVGGASIGISATTEEQALDDAYYLGEDGWVNWRNCTG